jgi:hypothetical protein
MKNGFPDRRGFSSPLSPATIFHLTAILSFVIPERSRGICSSADLSWRRGFLTLKQNCHLDRVSAVERSAVFSFLRQRWRLISKGRFHRRCNTQNPFIFERTSRNLDPNG